MKPVYQVMRFLVVLAAAGVLAACGGGGGGESSGNPDGGSTTPPAPTPNPPNPPNPPPANLPGLSSVGSTIHAAATVGENVGPSMSLVLVITGAQQEQSVYLGGSYSTTGIFSANISQTPVSTLVTVVFRVPGQLGAGTYEDTVTIVGCLESPCVNQLTGSPLTLRTTYTVNPAPPPPPPPAMTLEKNNVSSEGFLLDPAPSTHTVDITFTNLPSAQVLPYVFLSGSTNAITQSSFHGVAGTVGRVSIELDSPEALGIGTFSDTLTIQSCIDLDCIQELAGSPAEIAVEYTVTDTVPGENGYTVKNVAANANDMVWDENREVFYVSIMSTDPDHPDSIGVLDPETGEFSSYASVGADPGRMALSPDGQYLYVAVRGPHAVQRLALPSLSIDGTISLGVNWTGTPYDARELHVSPDAPTVVGVIREFSGQTFGLAIVDGDVLLPMTVGESMAPFLSTFQWDTGARIIGVNSYSSSGEITQISVDANGAQATSSQNDVTSFDGEVRLADGRLYMQRGQIIDPVSYQELGVFGSGRSDYLTVDAAGNRAFLQDGSRITSFTLTTQEEIAQLLLPNSSPSFFHSRILRWGDDGLAMLNHKFMPPWNLHGILLLHGPFVKPLP